MKQQLIRFKIRLKLHGYGAVGGGDNCGYGDGIAQDQGNSIIN